MKSEKNKTIQFSPSVLESETFESTEYKDYILTSEDVIEELSPTCFGDFLWRQCLGEDDVLLYDDEVSETLLDVNTRNTKKKNVKKNNDSESTKVVTKSRSRSTASSSTGERKKRKKRNDLSTPKEIIISAPSLKSASSISAVNNVGAVDQDQRMKPTKDTSGQRSTSSKKTTAKETTTDAVTDSGDSTSNASEGRRLKKKNADSDQTASKSIKTNSTPTNDISTSNGASSATEKMSPSKEETLHHESAREITDSKSQKNWMVRLVKRHNLMEKESSPCSRHAEPTQAVVGRTKTTSLSKDEIESKQNVSTSSPQVEPIVERVTTEPATTQISKSVATETPVDLQMSKDLGSAHPMNGTGSTGEKTNKMKTKKKKKDGNLKQPSFVLDGTDVSETSTSTPTTKVAAAAAATAASAEIYTTKSGHLGLKTQNVSPTSSASIGADYLKLVTSKAGGHESVVASKTSRDNENTTSYSILKNRNDVIMIDQSDDSDSKTKNFKSMSSAPASTFTSRPAVIPTRDIDDDATTSKSSLMKSESPKEMRLRAGSMKKFTGRLSSRKSLGSKVEHRPVSYRIVSVVEKRDEEDDTVGRDVGDDEVFLIMPADIASNDQGKADEPRLNDMSLAKVFLDATKASAMSKLWTDFGKMFVKSPEPEKLALETLSESSPSEEIDGRLSSLKSLEKIYEHVDGLDAEEFILVTGEGEGVGWKPVCGVGHSSTQQEVDRKYSYKSDVPKKEILKAPARIGVEARNDAKRNYGYDKQSGKTERVGGNMARSSPSWERRDQPSPFDVNDEISGYCAHPDTHVLVGDNNNQKYRRSVDEKDSKSPRPGWRVRPGSFAL